MKQLKDLTQKEIFDEMHKFCILSDIDAPQDDAALTMIIDFIKQNHGNYDARVLSWAFELWMQGDIEVIKPRRINAYFISQIIKKGVKDNLIKHPFVPKPSTQPQEKILNADEEYDLSERTYHRLFDQFVAYYRNNDVQLVLKLLEVQYSFIKDTKDPMQFSHTQLYDMQMEVLKYYEHRIDTLNKEDKMYHWNAIQKTLPAPPVDMNKVTPVWCHFYKRWQTEKNN